MTKRVDLLEALLSTPVDISRVLGPLVLEQLDNPYGQSVSEVMIRFIQIETEFQKIIASCVNDNGRLHTDKPVIIRADESIMELWEQFRCARKDTLELLKSLTPAEWQRRVDSPSFVGMTLRFYTHSLVESDIRLTSEIVELIQAGRRPPSGGLAT